MSPTRDTTRTIAVAVAFSILGLLALGTLFLIRHVLLVLYVSGLLSVGLIPAVRWIERSATGRRQPRWAAILVIYLILVGFFAGLVTVVVPPLGRQAAQLQQALPSYLDQAQSVLVDHGLISHTYTWSEVLQKVPSPTSAVGGVFVAVQSVAGIVGALITVFVLPYYILLEAESLHRGLLRFFPRDRRPQMAELTRTVTYKVSAWLGGQLMLALLIGSTTALALWLLGVPYFYVLALIAGVGELIPVVGPILAAVPAVLAAATVSLETGAFTIAFFVVQQFVENHFLVPRMMERQVGVSPVTVIVALLIGSEMLGLVGALLAVPSAAIVQLFVQQYLGPDEPPAATPADLPLEPADDEPPAPEPEPADGRLGPVS